MLSKIKRNNQKGFTIIEVMIVLAVAALILLIVLLAVPALQRNAKNTALKNDASSVSGAIGTWTADNNGVVPNSVTNYKGSAFTSTVTLGNGTASSNETVSVQPTTQVGFYAMTTPGPEVFTGSTTQTAMTSGQFTVSKIGPQQIAVVFGGTCPNNNTAASTSTVAVVYGLLVAGGNVSPQCIQAE
jgi:prepilin-type N-terminal cleavage/methylation domain-containing protein